MLVVSKVNSFVMGSMYLSALDTPVPWKTWLNAGATDEEQVCGE